MTSAFSNQPGGCCCGGDGYFDVYSNTAATVSHLVRWSSLRKTASVFKSDDTGAIDWFIDPATGGNVQYGASATGFPAFGKRVWAQKFYQVGPGAVSHVALYDTILEQELFDVPFASFPLLTPYSGFGPGFSAGPGSSVPFGSTTQTAFVNYDGQILYVLDDTGQLTATPAIHSSASESVNVFAWRNWPRGAGTFNGNLCIGDVAVSDGQLTLNNRQTILPGSVFGAQWRSFDASPTHWAGVWLAGSKSLLVIDGVLVKSSFNNGNFGEPHVCHPHETLGDGWVGVPQLRWAVEPTAFSAGTLADPSHPWYIQFYKNGQPAWSIIAPWPNIGIPRIDHSSDRWIYINDLSNARGSLNIQATVFEQIPNRWKHDGSQHWRSGVLNGNTTTPDGKMPAQLQVGDWGGYGTSAVVQNSAALKNALPLDFPPPQ